MRDFFTFRKGSLYCEEVPLAALAEQYGTPLYVYSKAAIVTACRRLQTAFQDYPTLPCYAVKANSNLNILRLIAGEGFGADVVSQGELERALKAGIAANRIVFSGVGKTDGELAYALGKEILSFQVESLGELSRLNTLAQRKKKIAPICLRVNPNIDAKTNPHIATGLYSTKFGIAEKDLPAALNQIRELPQLKLLGISCHLGSQITSLAPFRAAARRMVQLVAQIRDSGMDLKILDFGGGLAIAYRNEKVASVEQYATAILPVLKKTGLSLILEPGRSIVGASSVLLTQVIEVKKTPKKRFVIVDAAMSDLIRPVLYGAHHRIEPITQIEGRGQFRVDVVGPICESADFFAHNREMPEVLSKELLAIRDCGAYGFSMASHYNSRPKPAEVLVDQNDSRLIRRREALAALWEHEVS